MPISIHSSFHAAVASEQSQQSNNTNGKSILSNIDPVKDGVGPSNIDLTKSKSIRAANVGNRMKNSVVKYGKELMAHPGRTLKASGKAIWQPVAAGAITGAIVGSTTGVGFFGGAAAGASLGLAVGGGVELRKDVHHQGKQQLLDAFSHTKTEAAAAKIKGLDDAGIIQSVIGKKKLKFSNLNLNTLNGDHRSAQAIADALKTNQTNESSGKLEQLSIKNNARVDNQYFANLLSKAKDSLKENHTLNIKNTGITGGSELKEAISGQMDGVKNIKLTEGKETREGKMVNLKLSLEDGKELSLNLKVNKDFIAQDKVAPQAATEEFHDAPDIPTTTAQTQSA